MSLKQALGSLALVTSLAALGTGCVVRAQGQIAAPVAYVEVEEEPPPPRVVVVDTRPGFVWVEGRWYRQGNRWEWRDGYWERERAGQVWEQGRWERRGRGHVWVDGRWRAGGGGTVYTQPQPVGVRDHRAQPMPQPVSQPAPAVRDHRQGNQGNDNNQGNGPAVRDHRHH